VKLLGVQSGYNARTGETARGETGEGEKQIREEREERGVKCNEIDKRHC